METLNLILDLAYEIGFNIVSSFFIYGAIGSFIGFIIAVWAVRKINKAKGFQRAFGLWTFAAKLNMVYLPIVGIILFGTLGGTYGLNSSINGYLESAVSFSFDQLTPYVNDDIIAKTIAEYGASFMITDVIDTMFWIAYRGIFIFGFFTLMQWPIIEFIIHKVYSIIFGTRNDVVKYSYS